jgi:hypothetical protein
METEKGSTGRPRKKEGRIESWQFARAVIVISGYDDFRARGEQHSVAVGQAVDRDK